MLNNKASRLAWTYYCAGLCASLLRPFRHRKPSSVEQNCALLNLPLDLLYDIFDELPLPEKILLAQSCRALRFHLRDKCLQILREKTTLAERLACLAVLAEVLPDHRLCVGCRALHPVDPKDLPRTAVPSPQISRIDTLRPYRHYGSSSSCPWPEPECSLRRLGSSLHTLGPCYIISARHVQLALKYSRTKGFHQSYLESILQKFHVSTTAFSSSLGMSLTVQPRIVRDRFLLRAEFLFYPGGGDDRDGLLSYDAVSRAKVDFCPHQFLGLHSDSHPSMLKVIRSAFDQADDSAAGVGVKCCSCDRCPTDFEITVLKDRLAKIYVWLDLGTGKSPEDTYWRTHVWNIDAEVGHKSGSVIGSYGSEILREIEGKKG